MVEIKPSRHILCRYGIISDEEAHKLQKSISCLETELGFIARKFARLQNQQSALMTALSVWKARLAPIHCLPSEIAGEIFHWVWVREPGLSEAHVLGDPYHSRLKSRPLLHLNLLRVCKKWRDIAVRIPMLWSGLRLNIIPFTNDYALSLQTWLSRSGSSSLDIDICDGYMQPWGMDGDTASSSRLSMQMVVRNLQPHMQRCSHLAVTISQPENVDDIKVILPSQTRVFPQLEYLSMDIKCPQSAILVDLSSCPRLVCYSWSHNPQYQGTCTSVRELAIITEHRLIRELQASCPSVTTCRLHNSGHLFDADDPVILLSQVTELHIEGYLQFASTGSVLDHLMLPALQKLSISMATGPILWLPNPEQEAPELARLFERSNPPLLELKLDTYYIGETALIQALACIPTIRSLKISADYLSDAIWHALTLSESTSKSAPTSDLCPELAELKLTSIGHCSLFAVIRMVLSRFFERDGSASCMPLRVLHLQSVLNELEGSELLHNPGIRCCIEAGLDISLTPSIFSD